MKNKKQDPKNSKKDNSKGNPSPDENLKALQRKLSKRDEELKKAQSALKKIQDARDDDRSDTEKLVDGFKDQIKKLTDEVGQINSEKHRQTLAEKYPDILPELLEGKTDEQVEKIVEKQRSLAKDKYGDSQFFRQPTYKDGSEIDKEIEEVKEDEKKTGEESALKVLGLNRLKNNLFNK